MIWMNWFYITKLCLGNKFWQDHLNGLKFSRNVPFVRRIKPINTFKCRVTASWIIDDIEVIPLCFCVPKLQWFWRVYSIYLKLQENVSCIKNWSQLKQLLNLVSFFCSFLEQLPKLINCLSVFVQQLCLNNDF